MDLKGLEYVVAVADANSFTRASKALFVAQPALSRKISQVEKEFGAALFDRAGRGAKLTRAGEVFYHWASLILSDCENLKSDMERISRRAQPLRLVYFTNGSVPYVAAAVRLVKEKYPEIEVFTQPSTSLSPVDSTFMSSLELIRTQKLDALFAFLPMTKNEGLDWIDFKRIEEGGLCAFAADDHPILAPGAACARKISEYPLIFPPDSFAPELTRAMRSALGDPPRVSYSLDSTDFRVRIITEGFVGIMPASSRNIESHFLHCVPVSDVTTGFDLIAVWNKRDKNPALQKFISLL